MDNIIDKLEGTSEIQERESRKNNVIIFGEAMSKTEGRIAHDKAYVGFVLQELDIDIESVEEGVSRRLGENDDGKK